MRHAFLAGMMLLAVGTVDGKAPGQRTLTFEDRVRAQESLERVYYSHQIGTTKSFEQAMTRAILEDQVRTYLDQTAAWRCTGTPS